MFPFEIGQDIGVEDYKGSRLELRLIASTAECFLSGKSGEEKAQSCENACLQQFDYNN